MKSLVFTILCIIVINQVRAQINIDFEKFDGYLEDKKYNQLISEVKVIRSSDPYGKNWWIDYYTGMGYCGKGDKTTADMAFEYILLAYPNDTAVSDLIKHSQSSCFHPAPIRNDNFSELLAFAKDRFSESGERVGKVGGKLGYVLNCEKAVELYEFAPDFDYNEIQNRLFNLDEKERAATYYQNFLKANKYKIDTSGRFVIVSLKKRDLKPAEVRKTAEKLERIYQFYLDYYDVLPPDKLLTVYLMGNTQRLREVALETHGLILPRSNYGYSNLADLSILGNSNSRGLGTMAHELFHLVIRSQIGDIPGWLDEGIASLYEESHWEDDTLKHNSIVWRTTVLRQNNEVERPLPFLSTLLTNNWSEFTPNSATTLCELTVNYALAKHFVMYLEDKRQLQIVVNAYKYRKNVLVDPTFENESTIEVLENALKKELPDIQKDFDAWLLKEYKITSTRDVQTIRNKLHDLENLRHFCDRNDPDFISYQHELNKLLENLPAENNLSPEMLKLSINIISQGEEMYLRCR